MADTKRPGHPKCKRTCNLLCNYLWQNGIFVRVPYKYGLKVRASLLLPFCVFLCSQLLPGCLPCACLASLAWTEHSSSYLPKLPHSLFNLSASLEPLAFLASEHVPHNTALITLALWLLLGKAVLTLAGCCNAVPCWEQEAAFTKLPQLLTCWLWTTNFYCLKLVVSGILLKQQKQSPKLSLVSV